LLPDAVCAHYERVAFAGVIRPHQYPRFQRRRWPCLRLDGDAFRARPGCPWRGADPPSISAKVRDELSICAVTRIPNRLGTLAGCNVGTSHLAFPFHDRLAHRGPGSVRPRRAAMLLRADILWCRRFARAAAHGERKRGHWAARRAARLGLTRECSAARGAAETGKCGTGCRPLPWKR
jgi:hypothetical protein